MDQETLWAFFLRASFRIKLRLVFLCAAAVAVVLTSGWMIGTILWFQAHPVPSEFGQESVPDKAPAASTAKKEDKKEAEKSPSDFTFTYEIKNVSVVLLNRRGNHNGFAQFTIAFDCPNAEGVKQLKLNHAKLIDAILDVGTTYYLDDFSTAAGIASFKGSLLARFKADFKELGPRNIAFKEWMMN